MRRILSGGLLLTLAVVLCGCFETTLNLGSADKAKVEAQYCGQWKFEWKSGDTAETAFATLCNFDGRQYFVEWKEDEKVQRLSAFFVPIKNAQFAQISNLGTELAEKHTIMRVALKDGKLGVRSLSKEFFDGITTDAALREKVEANVDNEAMYEGEWIWATKVGE